MLPQSPFNETHWQDPEYLKLFNAALAELDLTKRNEICRAMETIEFERGGYIIPSFNQLVDLAASNVNGLHPGTIFAMGDYDFANIWLS
jgi:peptide/nickel transport system substrate-binding protein